MNSRAHQVKVAEVVAETADAVSLVFDVGEDLTDAFTYRPGQFVTVRVPSDRTGSVARCYSLCSSPHCDARPVITVKRTRGGYASNWLCDNVSAGSVLTVLEPAGTFVPRSLDEGLVLCAAGSGITPILSIAKSVLYGGSGSLLLLYANRDRESVIFAARLAALEAEFPDRLRVLHWLEYDRGLPEPGGVARLLDAVAGTRMNGEYGPPGRDLDGLGGREIFVCGPEGFARAVHQAAWRLGVSPQRVHREEYHSLTENPFDTTPPREVCGGGPDGAIVEVEFQGDTHVLTWPRTSRLLDVLLDAGLDAPYICRESACGTCVCRVEEGTTRMVACEALIEEEIADGLTLACQTLPVSDRVRITFDRGLP